MNAFRIPYIVVHDEDPIPQGLSQRKLADATRMFNLNPVIRSDIDASVGTVEILNPDFDAIVGTTKNQIAKYGKPFATFKRLRSKRRSQIPPRLVEVAQLISS